MSVAWDDPVIFSWDKNPFLYGRPMTLGAAVDYFAGLSPQQKECARITLSSPVQLSMGLPAAYEFAGLKIDALVTLRRSASARLAA